MYFVNNVFFISLVSKQLLKHNLIHDF